MMALWYLAGLVSNLVKNLGNMADFDLPLATCNVLVFVNPAKPETAIPILNRS